MAKITLFEFNPEGSIQIGPSGEGEEGLLSISTEEETETTEETEETEESGGGGIAKVIVPLVALIGIAAAVRYFAGSDELAEELDEEETGRLDRFKTTTE